MEQLVISDFNLGIIAGGQLGKILALTASNWNINTFILDPDDQCPASSCATAFFKGNYLDFDDVYGFTCCISFNADFRQNTQGENHHIRC